MFSKRHYEFMAAFFSYELGVSTGESWEADQTREQVITGLARLLALKFGQDNPKFNRNKFLAACGLTN